MLLTSSCQKDESALNDYDLFGRLQFGSGTWELVETQSFDNSVENPSITTSQPAEKTIYHYFMHSSQISGVIVDIPSVKIYYDETSGPPISSTHSTSLGKLLVRFVVELYPNSDFIFVRSKTIFLVKARTNKGVKRPM